MSPFVPDEYHDLLADIKKKEQPHTGYNLELNQLHDEKAKEEKERLVYVRSAFEQCILSHLALWGFNRRFQAIQWPWCGLGCSHPLQAIHSDILTVVFTHDRVSVPVVVIEVESKLTTRGPNYRKDQIAAFSTIQGTKSGTAIIIDSQGYGCFDFDRTPSGRDEGSITEAKKKRRLQITGTCALFQAEVPNATPRNTFEAPIDLDGSIVANFPDPAVQNEPGKFKRNVNAGNGVQIASFGKALNDIYLSVVRRLLLVSRDKGEMEVCLDSMAKSGFQHPGTSGGAKDCCPPCVFKFTSAAERREDLEMIFKYTIDNISVAGSDKSSGGKREMELCDDFDDEMNERKKLELGPRKVLKVDGDDFVDPGPNETEAVKRFKARTVRQNSNDPYKRPFAYESASCSRGEKVGAPILPRDETKKCCHMYSGIVDAIDRAYEEMVRLTQQPQVLKPVYSPDEKPNRRPGRASFFNNPMNCYTKLSTGSVKNPSTNESFPKPKYPAVHRSWNPTNWLYSVDDLTTPTHVSMKWVQCEDPYYDRKVSEHSFLQASHPKVALVHAANNAAIRMSLIPN